MSASFSRGDYKLRCILLFFFLSLSTSLPYIALVGSHSLLIYHFWSLVQGGLLLSRTLGLKLRLLPGSSLLCPG